VINSHVHAPCSDSPEYSIIILYLVTKSISFLALGPGIEPELRDPQSRVLTTTLSQQTGALGQIRTDTDDAFETTASADWATRAWCLFLEFN
jgi:hypothetical protein